MNNDFKIIKFSCLIFALAVLQSCTPSLSTSAAYFQQVQPAKKGVPVFTEFIINFTKPTDSTIEIRRAIVYGHNGKDYHFENLILNDATLTKTIKSTTDITSFSIYLKDRHAARSTNSTSEKLMAKIFYNDGSSDKILDVIVFEDKGENRMGD